MLDVKRPATLATLALENDSTLHEIVARLVKAVDPEKLILFGSRARGGAAPSSDYDIMIVKSEPDPASRRTGPLYRHLWGIPGSVDLLWFTPQEIDDWSRVRQHVATQAVRNGVVVYEKRR
jgi:predicted nucleotidyltransferase